MSDVCVFMPTMDIIHNDDYDGPTMSDKEMTDEINAFHKSLDVDDIVIKSMSIEFNKHDYCYSNLYYLELKYFSCRIVASEKLSKFNTIRFKLHCNINVMPVTKLDINNSECISYCIDIYLSLSGTSGLISGTCQFNNMSNELMKKIDSAILSLAHKKAVEILGSDVDYYFVFNHKDRNEDEIYDILEALHSDDDLF